jgi:alkylation response protein AidB-like acyl-CoA dehydrogenase
MAADRERDRIRDRIREIRDRSRERDLELELERERDRDREREEARERERERSTRGRLDVPRATRRRLLPEYDPDAFGRLSEEIARFLGTGRFIVWMTFVVTVWIAWNVLLPAPLRFDEYPFIFLTRPR